jgi:hypothetical protein
MKHISGSARGRKPYLEIIYSSLPILLNFKGHRHLSLPKYTNNYCYLRKQRVSMGAKEFKKLSL